MPEPRTLEISEMFWSAQGEGSRCGIPSIFVRLAGCRVRCPYCDTRHAWSGGRTMAPDEISGEISKLEKRFPASQIVFTGGEPLEQNMTETVACLRQKNSFIAVETSGLYFQDLPVDWWSVSPKDVTGFHIHPRLVSRMDEVKLIVNRNLTLAILKKIRSRAVRDPHFPSAAVFPQEQISGKHSVCTKSPNEPGSGISGWDFSCTRCSVSVDHSAGKNVGNHRSRQWRWILRMASAKLSMSEWSPRRAGCMIQTPSSEHAFSATGQ